MKHGRLISGIVLASALAGGGYLLARLHAAPVAVPGVSAEVVWQEPVSGGDVPPIFPVAEPATALEALPEPMTPIKVPELVQPDAAPEEAAPAAPAVGPLPLVPKAPEPLVDEAVPVPPPGAAPAPDDVSGSVVAAASMMAENERPLSAFAKPFTRPGKQPLVAIVVMGLGMSQGATRAAVQDLPGGVTLAFSAYAPRLPEQMEQARVAGHELLLMVPMQSSSEQDDPGPDALMASLPESENLARLRDVLARATGYVGVMPWMGSGFLSDPAHFRPVLRRLWENGLMFVGGSETPLVSVRDAAEGLSVPVLLPDAVIDASASRREIDAKLAGLLAKARQNGMALGLASAYPVTIERLAAWTSGLKSEKAALAPASALLRKELE